MPERIPQSATIRVPLQAYLSSDHISPATGKTIAVTISKNGGAYGNPSGGATNATEIGSGSYYVDLSTTDTGTLGPLFVKGTEGTIDAIIAIYNVVNANNGGLAALPNAAAEAAGGLYTRGSGAGQINQDANGMIDVNVVRLANVAQSLSDLKDFADDGYDPSTNKVQGVVLADTVTTYTGNTPQTGDAYARVGANGSGLTAVPWNAAWDAEVQSEVQDAIEANHLDHLLAATYDPASKPGAADALLNELIGNDAGVSQFTANALELAPAGGGGGDATEAKQDAIIALIGTPADTDLATDIANISAGGGTIFGESGDYKKVIHVTAGGQDVPDAVVRLRKAGEGWSPYFPTDSMGRLDVYFTETGTYAYQARKNGVSIPGPVSFEVTEDDLEAP